MCSSILIEKTTLVNLTVPKKDEKGTLETRKIFLAEEHNFPNSIIKETSRDRPKSAPYPRLKYSKRTSKCQFTVLENRKAKKMDRVARRGPLKRKKNSQCRKKLKGGTLWDFSTSILSQNSKKKLKGDPLGKNFFSKKKSRSAEKNERGDPLVSPGMVCYAGKQEKPFWFSSLDKIEQFGAIIFCRTFKNYFGQFVWIGKKEKPL